MFDIWNNNRQKRR